MVRCSQTNLAALRKEAPVATNRRVQERKRRQALVTKYDCLVSCGNDHDRVISVVSERVQDLKQMIRRCTPQEVRDGSGRMYSRWLRRAERELANLLNRDLHREKLEVVREMRTLRTRNKAFPAFGPSEPEYEDQFTNRRRFRRGWGDSYMSTRKRYWLPSNNNWKQHRRYQFRPQ